MIANVKDAFAVVATHPVFTKFIGDYWTNDFNEAIYWAITNYKGTTEFFIEAGSWSVENKSFYDDYDLHVTGGTFEEALINLANKVIGKYGHVSVNDFYEDCEPYPMTIGKRADTGDDITFMIVVEFNKKKFREWRDSVGLETPDEFGGDDESICSMGEIWGV